MCDPRLKSLLGQNTKGAFLLTWHQRGLTAKTSKNQSTSSSQASNNSQEPSKSWQNHFTSRFISILPASGIRSLCVSLCACVSLYGFECECVWERAWAKSLQSYPTFCNPTDSSPPGSSVHGILQARVLEYWVAMPCSRGSSRPRDLNLCLQRLLHCGWILYCRAARKAPCVHTHLHLFCACPCHAGLILVTCVSIFQITLWLSLQSSALTWRLGEVTFCYLMQGRPGIFWLMAWPLSAWWSWHFAYCSPLTIIFHLWCSEIWSSLLEMRAFSRWYQSKLCPSVPPPLPSYGKDLKRKPWLSDWFLNQHVFNCWCLKYRLDYILPTSKQHSNWFHS